MQRLQKIGTKDTKKTLSIAKKNLTEKKELVENIATNMSAEKDIDLKAIQKQQYKKAQGEMNILEERIQVLEDELEAIQGSIVTYKEYLKSFEIMGKSLKNNKKMKKFDEYIKTMFLNFTVDRKNVVDYSLKAPFGAFEDLDKEKILKCGHKPCRVPLS